MSIENKPTNFQFKFLRAPLRTYVKSKYKLTIDKNDTIELKPPYIILANHVNNWDPIFLNCYVEEAISFVAAAPVFLNPTVGKALRFTGAISKTKGRADRQTVRDIIKAKKAGRVIGLFPEGNRSWNGHTEPLVYSTSKLIKLLNIPVVVATIHGGYLSQPRWSDAPRKGKTYLSFEKLWDVGELKDMDIDVVHEKLSAALAYSDLDWQKQSGIEFKGKRIANYLERHLFTCPSCHEIGTMHSEDDEFSCQSCGYAVRYNTKGTLEQVNGELQFSEIFDWDQWQLEHAHNKMTDPTWCNQLTKKLADVVKVGVSKNGSPYEWLGNFDFNWTGDGVKLTQHANNISPIEMKFEEMDGVNVQMHHNLDFFYNDDFYRVQFVEPRASAYMWYRFIEMNQEHSE